MFPVYAQDLPQAFVAVGKMDSAGIAQRCVSTGSAVTKKNMDSTDTKSCICQDNQL